MNHRAIPTTKIGGFKLALYQQGSADAPKLALVLPGLLDSKDYPNTRSHVELLAKRGYHAIAFDAPGIWDSAGDISSYTMTNCLKAIKALAKAYGHKPTLLMGHSMGGLLAALAAAQLKNVAGLIMSMSPEAVVRVENGEQVAVRKPVSKWRELGVHYAERDVPGDPTDRKTFELPFSFVEDAMQYNSHDILKELTVPKLFIAGKEDIRIPPARVQTIFAEAAGPKDFALVDTNHDYRRDDAAIESVNKIITTFLDKYNR